MTGTKQLASGRYQSRYFRGYDETGKRVYLSRTFELESDAITWRFEQKRAKDFEAELPPHVGIFPRRWAKQNFSAIKGGAKYRKIPFDLTFADFERLVANSGGRCMLTGIPFDFTRGVKRRRRPFAPSVDRIEATQGYTVENCRLVCCIVNYALGDWGLDCLMRVARHLVAREPFIMPAVRACGSTKVTPLCTVIAQIPERQNCKPLKADGVAK